MHSRSLWVLLVVLVAFTALGAKGELPYDSMVGNVILLIFVIGAIVLFVGALALACIGVVAAVVVPAFLIGLGIVAAGLAICVGWVYIVVFVPFIVVATVVRFFLKLRPLFYIPAGMVVVGFIVLLVIGTVYS